jgi:hypothetical protein
LIIAFLPGLARLVTSTGSGRFVFGSIQSDGKYVRPLLWRWKADMLVESLRELSSKPVRSVCCRFGLVC